MIQEGGSLCNLTLDYTLDLKGGKNNKLFLQGIGRKGVDWIFPFQNKGTGGYCEEGNETLGFTSCREFLTISGNFSYSTRTTLHGDIYSEII